MFLKNSWKYFVTVIVISLTVYLINSNVSNKQIREDITIAVAEQPAFALIYVAYDKGYFKDEGLNVSFKKHILGRDALKDVVEDKAELATVFDIPTLNQIDKGVDLGILTALHSSSKNHAIASFTKSGIKTAKDLKGKRVAMTKGVSTEFFLYSFLLGEGISLSEVTAISIEPDQMISTLETGSVDAAVLFNPYIYNFQQKYLKEQVNFLYSDDYTEMSVLTGKRETIENNQSKILKVLRALYKAEKFIKTDRAESIKTVDKWLPSYGLGGVESSWNIFDFSLRLDNKLITTMEREAAFFSNTGVYSSDIPYLRKYYLIDYLQMVKPEGVTLY